MTKAAATPLRSLRLAEFSWVLERRPAGRGAATDRVHLPNLVSVYPFYRREAHVDFCGRLSQREAIVATSRAIRANDVYRG